MKVFISSLISNMENFRLAAREGVELLGHEVVMAEDFGAKPLSPQIACLQGLRRSGLVILILGEHYGAKQANGISATHEEYREAKGHYPVIAFVQNIPNRDTEESAFVKEVQGWEGGLFRGGFDTTEQLKNGIIKAIHEWQISVTAAPLDFDQLSSSAFQVVEASQKQNTHSSGSPKLLLSIIGGPIQPILRPSEIEKTEFADDLIQGALFGPHRIFDKRYGSQAKMDSDSLVIYQEETQASVSIDPQGGILFQLNIHDQSNRMSGMAVIKEQLESSILNAFKYACWLLDKIDATQRLTHVSFAVGFKDSNGVLIRTRAESDASPNSYSFGHSFDSKNVPVQLKPSYRSRSAIGNDPKTLTDDLITLLKRASS
ncbi:DUF4062 domain-containing protein [Mucilaginibacter sp.]|uniref:DUF4062 domain-containing protein n=1 Tax=Mucilaginibacter sp. TaxID=1882438 RepID=UPI0035BC906E